MAEKMKRRLLEGNEACALGAIYAGCRFFAGYPITPSTEIAEELARELPGVGGKFIQMEDEIAAMAAICGASLTGKKVMTATSGPGFSLKQENIGFACIAEIPCVVVDVQRGGPSTGYPTGPSQSDIMQAKWGTHGDHTVIALCPNSVTESFTLTVKCFNLAEKYRTPVIFLLDEVIGHMREPITIPEPGALEVADRARADCPPEEYKPYDVSRGLVPLWADFGSGYRYHVTGLNHDETGFPTNDGSLFQEDEERQLRKIGENLDDILEWEESCLDDAEVAIVACGSSARSGKMAVETARAEGIKAGMLRPITLWPFPEKRIEELADQVKAIVVPEMNLGQMVLEVERASHGKCKIDGIFKVNSEPIHPTEIVRKIKEVL